MIPVRKTVCARGDIRWKACGTDLAHKEDGPAVIMTSGTKAWFIHGQMHRTDGPALMLSDGKNVWYYNGKRHREDGPAHEGGSKKQWYIHGVRHREDGPAIEYGNGDYSWYVHGKLHRIDGPAMIFSETDYPVEWYLYGEYYDTIDDFCNELKSKGLATHADIVKLKMSY